MTGADNLVDRGSTFRKMLCSFILFATLLSTIEAYSTGAPKTACSTLTPVHPGFQAQRTSSPYQISVVKSGNKVKVRIFSTYAEEIQGFVLQARSSKDKHKIIDGQFSQQDGTRATDCFQGKQNTLTHVDPSPKREIITEFSLLSTNLNEDVIFRATVAKTYATFWTEIDSDPIRITSRGSGSPSSPNRSEQKDSSSIYHNCFITKGCFGLPERCVDSRNCDVLLSYMHTGTGISFTLNGFLQTNAYMAMALSYDNEMGNDFVTACFHKGSSIRAQESYNQGKTNSANRELSREYRGSSTNGLATCSWETKYLAESPNGDTFNLQNKTYYVLLAKGPFNERNERLGYHDSKLASADPVNFTTFESISALGVRDPIKIHGCLMITAWVGFLSLAIIMSRHFKTAFHEKTFCGVKVWFAMHRAFAASALLLIVIAFITIFVYKNGWNYETSNPHAILGTIATVLALFQPIMAAFRPAPDHNKRPLFNWGHFLVGNSAYVLAMITIFFAVSLESSGLKESFYYVFSIFVILYVVSHVIFQVHALTSGRKGNNEVKMLDMSQARSNTMQNNIPEKSRTDTFRILLLGIYTIILIILLMTMYALVAVA